MENERTSYLSHAQATDVEAYRAYRDAHGGKTPKRKAQPPALYEWTWEHEALAALFSLMQQHIHVTSQSKKKAQVKPWPRPRTAAQILAREESRERHRHVESMLRFEGDPPKK